MDATQHERGPGLRMVAGAVSLAAVAAAFAAGYLLRWGLSPAAPTPAPASQPAVAGRPAEPAAPAIWTCSMHPQIRQPKPGKCPICHMDLIPVDQPAAEGADARIIPLSQTAKALLRVETAPVERKYVEAEVRMVGKVDYDETRLAYLTAWMPGRLDRLFVNYTGMPVRKGDHMVEIYSPTLLSAQEELLQARKAAAEVKPDDSLFVRESAATTLAAAREKLRLLGLTEEQVEEIARRGKGTDRLTIVAPAGGIVVQVNARQGMYVDTGAQMFAIADLSQVWVRLDAYETDLAWLRYGQKAEFTADGYPGRRFGGMISFIDPILTEQTRTVRVRVDAPNGDGALKPGMFVRAVVRSRIAAGGKVVAPDLAGKWISPMHPEVIKDAPGVCDVCGMPLVRAESLGYVTADPNTTPPPLVVPVSAALRTGRRGIVYVERPASDGSTYEMRQVALGPRAGDYHLVEDGLAEGERVVVKGSFLIDSERQIRGLPSMMEPRGVGAAGHPGHERGASAAPPAPTAARPTPLADPASRGLLAKLFDAYFAMSGALAAGDAPKAQAAARSARQALAEAPPGKLGEAAGANWKAHAGMVGAVLDRAAAAGGIEPVRVEFALLSDQMAVVAKAFGGPDKVVYRLHCPMAFNNRGATWLQLDGEVRNPYFGAAMLGCGSVVETIPPPASAAATRPATGAAHDH